MSGPPHSMKYRQSTLKFPSSTPEIDKGQTSGSQRDAEQEKASTSFHLLIVLLVVMS